MWISVEPDTFPSKKSKESREGKRGRREDGGGRRSRVSPIPLPVKKTSGRITLVKLKWRTGCSTGSRENHVKENSSSSPHPSPRQTLPTLHSILTEPHPQLLFPSYLHHQLQTKTPPRNHRDPSLSKVSISSYLRCSRLMRRKRFDERRRESKSKVDDEGKVGNKKPSRAR